MLGEALVIIAQGRKYECRLPSAGVIMRRLYLTIEAVEL